MRRAGNLPPDRLRIEITETESMNQPEVTIRRMDELLGRGIEVFVDDFGTGHSSLSYLKELPATTLKIDKSFIQHVDHEEDERQLLRALVDIARIRKKKVIVEGVASPAQQGVTRTLSCDFLQGYLYRPPVSTTDFGKLLVGNGDGVLASPPRDGHTERLGRPSR
jgi:EAL domain-containing protein (putative c-di-GMP-specific phosphodiesterase class I)